MGGATKGEEGKEEEEGESGEEVPGLPYASLEEVVVVVEEKTEPKF